MLLRYVRSREYVLNLSGVEINVLLLSLATERKVKSMSEKLKNMDEVTRKFQWIDTSIRSACAFFDTILTINPNLSKYLNLDAQIVQNPHFESELLKI